MHSGMNIKHSVRNMVAQQQHQDIGNGNSTTNKQQQHIKRPLNAFMVWSRSQRHKIKLDHPKMHTSEISKILGAKWKTMSADETRPFFDEAKRLKEQHMRDHPDYKFRRRLKPKPAVKSTDLVMPIFQDINNVRSDSVHSSTSSPPIGQHRNSEPQQKGMSSPNSPQMSPPVSIATRLHNFPNYNSYKPEIPTAGISQNGMAMHYGHSMEASSYGQQNSSLKSSEPPVKGTVPVQPLKSEQSMENTSSNSPGVQSTSPFIQSLKECIQNI